MVLPSTYADRNCPMARALEVVGERWTLLLVRDAFYGVHRFGDFATQLGIPRAVLTNRLKLLVREGVMDRIEDEPGTVEYRLTDKGLALWPVLRTLLTWGNEHCSPGGPTRDLRHDTDDGLLDPDGRCPVCGEVVPVAAIRVEPGPAFTPSRTDPISTALSTPHRLLTPLRP
jgi:DNA-binding HxlR family transcriptional regulator